MPVLPGSPPLEVHLRRSAAARRFSLRVSRLDGRVTLSLPLRAREAEAMAFLRGQEGWLRATLADMAAGAPVAVGPGTRLPVEGVERVVTPAPGRAVRVEGGALCVPGDPAQAGVRAGAFLRALARDRLAEATARHAQAVGRRVARLTLRDTRSRWGSCSHEGALMFSWRLVMAPPRVLDYVAAHEVAHLVRMDHSPAFWAVVEGLCPGWAEDRAWLHARGAELHRHVFGPAQGGRGD
jgi:hypothetical protein